MKMVKSLLLGSAAGLVAIAGAQAADLPVKAKPVEYVKVCSAYGAGFYYIPGTDICLRVGGYAFIETGYNARVGDAMIYSYTGAGVSDHQSRRQPDQLPHPRYGHPRRSLADCDRHRSHLHRVRRRLQQQPGWRWAGRQRHCLSRARVHPVRGLHGRSGRVVLRLRRVLLDLWLCRASPGIGRRSSPTRRSSVTASRPRSRSRTAKPPARRSVPVGGDCHHRCNAGNTYGGQQVPDIVGNLRVDQAWGSAQISGVLHQFRVEPGNVCVGLQRRVGLGGSGRHRDQDPDDRSGRQHHAAGRVLEGRGGIHGHFV